MVVVSTRSAVVRNCGFCGPRTVKGEVWYEKHRNLEHIICPSCHMDPGEVRMTQRVIDIGFEAALLEEINGAR